MWRELLRLEKEAEWKAGRGQSVDREEKRKNMKSERNGKGMSCRKKRRGWKEGDSRRERKGGKGQSERAKRGENIGRNEEREGKT